MSSSSPPKSDKMSSLSERGQSKFEATANRIMAVLMPLVQAGAAGYATYVVVVLICIKYLLSPSSDLQDADIEPRRRTAIALLVIYFILMAVMAITFLRLIQVIWSNPGYVPFADPDPEKGTVSTKDFDRLDAYISDYEGNPLWCRTCNNWKPDRTHHSSALGRCVRRMDHFCPYAGGIISETSHKFFTQFLLYGALYTGYVMILMAVFLAERNHKLHSTPATWIVALALAALFFLFSFGMFLTTVYNLAKNFTTIEAANRPYQTYNIALLGEIRRVSDRPSASNSAILSTNQRSQTRCYIVLQTRPGENPWDLGVLDNIKSIMGTSVIDWFIPLKMSPCTSHTGDVGHFEWGWVVQRLMDEYEAGSSFGGSRRSRRSRGSRSEPSRVTRSTPSRA
ncbi:zf-DHHC-domain-containing protein [Lindgomyces ingoldianus]|uniref:Zf-DHHC-domain-containing protein n=1 Tax=Lindgomyces ingoldianus TaxID=673940 RepID=A0ACB6QBN2_9PLEO|nr:zf-DHHC-domain-containing protein [Lindgomyces ingoldianus]KAF2464265.1 zf-DHHC-domain-containing protein [Lindgomyces ingoldianus]